MCTQAKLLNDTGSKVDFNTFKMCAEGLFGYCSNFGDKTIGQWRLVFESVDGLK